MPRFTKKPVTIEAVQWHEHGDHPAVKAEILSAWASETVGPDTHGMIETLEGDHCVSPGDWIIKGVKGELYPCKPDIFEATYEPADGIAGKSMGFGGAISALKEGHRVAREGWNGKGMWLALSCNNTREVPAEGFWSPHNAQHARDNGGSATVLPSITMKTADGSILMGWLASQTDMLADDWHIVDQQ
jgi:hypothetical protein